MSEESKFSTRFGFSGVTEPEITIRHDAPHDFRSAVVELAYEFEFRPSSLRTLLCRVLRKRPDHNNWSDFPNIDYEVRRLIDDIEWHRVYDCLEAIAENVNDKQGFESELNTYLVEEGIGWKMNKGRFEVRNPDNLEQSIQVAENGLKNSINTTAHGELTEAIRDLSRMPVADITGAIQHSMASLECVAREVTGDKKGTLGELIKRNPGMIPAPLDQSIEKLWGFASEYGRHIREGRNPEFKEAQLVVGVCSAAITYLLAKKDV